MHPPILDSECVVEAARLPDGVAGWLAGYDPDSGRSVLVVDELVTGAAFDAAVRAGEVALGKIRYSCGL